MQVDTPVQMSLQTALSLTWKSGTKLPVPPLLVRQHPAGVTSWYWSKRSQVGLVVGRDVGLWVGLSVGLPVVGRDVGRRVGLSVGLSVGRAVGLSVGELVGLFEGAAVGEKSLAFALPPT